MCFYCFSLTLSLFFFVLFCCWCVSPSCVFPFSLCLILLCNMHASCTFFLTFSLLVTTARGDDHIGGARSAAADAAARQLCFSVTLSQARLCVENCARSFFSLPARHTKSKAHVRESFIEPSALSLACVHANTRARNRNAQAGLTWSVVNERIKSNGHAIHILLTNKVLRRKKN